jgi:DNA primase small subunit
MPSSATPVRIYLLSMYITLSHKICRSVLEKLKHTFTTLILRDQDLFASDEAAAALLEHIPDPDIVEKVKDNWVSSACSSSEAKWVELLRTVRSSKSSDNLQVGVENSIRTSHSSSPRNPS